MSDYLITPHAEPLAPSVLVPHLVQDAEKTPRQVFSIPLGLVGIVPAQRDLLKSEQEALFPGPNRWGIPGGERLIGYQQRVH